MYSNIRVAELLLNCFYISVPCALENIDIRTKDPFTENEDNLWKVKETFYSIDDGIRVIDNSSL